MVPKVFQVIPLVVPVFLFGIFVFIIVLAFVYAKKRQGILKDLSGHLPGSMSRSAFSSSFSGEYQGLKFSIIIIPGGEDMPELLQITIFKKTALKLRVYKENPLSLWAEKIGLIHEAKTHDEVFDREFLLFSDKIREASGYFSNSSVKDSVRQLFGLGCDSLHCDGRKLFTRKPLGSRAEFDPVKILKAVQLLSSLVRGL